MKENIIILCRVLFDFRFRKDLVSEEITLILGIKRKTINYFINRTQQSKHITVTLITAQISSRVSDYHVVIDCIVLSKLGDFNSKRTFRIFQENPYFLPSFEMTYIITCIINKFKNV